MTTITEFSQHIQEYAHSFEKSDHPLYTKLLKSKSNWVPGSSILSDTEKASYAKPENSLKTIQKCIALALNLEIPVGEYVLDSFEKGIQDDARYILVQNAQDEEIHYKAFQNAAIAYDVPLDYIMEAAKITKEIPDLHPIFLAGYIELSLFFPVLAILRNYGGSGLRITTGDVSRDESRHVQTNWHLIQENNLDQETKHLRRFRFSVLDWLLCDHVDTQKDKTFWVNQSNKLYANKKTEDLGFTQYAIRKSFFEISNKNLSRY